MTHAEKCPVCNGSGEKKGGNEVYQSGITWREKCHGCHGKGWVTVHDDSMFTVKMSESSYPYMGDTRKGGE